MPLVEQELLILLDPLSSPLIFSGVRVTQSLVFCVMLVDCCLSFCLFSFGHCVVCSSIYRFWLPLWYLLAIVLSVLLFTDSDYPFGIFWPLCCLSFFDLQILIFWPLCCLSFFDLQILITPLVSSKLFPCTNINKMNNHSYYLKLLNTKYRPQHLG